MSIAEFSTSLPTRAYLGDSGIVLADGSVADAYGCRWRWAPTNPWGSKPSPRSQTGDRSFAHGQWDATRYYGPRNWPIPGTVRAPSHAALHFAEQRLRDAIDINPWQLRITEPGFDCYAMVRQEGEVLWTEDGTPAVPHATFNIGLYAPDPLIYSSLEHADTIKFPALTGGLSWPASWPATWSTSGSDGSKLLTNPSALPVGLDLTVTGPVDAMSIGFPTLGIGLNLANPEGPLLAAGDTLSIDTATRRVLLNGQANRRSWAYGQFPLLPANATTRIAIAGSGTTSSSKVDVSFHAARI